MIWAFKSCAFVCTMLRLIQRAGSDAGVQFLCSCLYCVEVSYTTMTLFFCFLGGSGFEYEHFNLIMDYVSTMWLGIDWAFRKSVLYYLVRSTPPYLDPNTLLAI